MRKLGVSESQGSYSQVITLFTALRLGAQKVLPQKAVSLAELLILLFRGSIVCWVSPKQGKEGYSPTGFQEDAAIVQSASGLRSLTDGCSETWSFYRWWIHSLWDQWWAGWQPNMVADSKSLYSPPTPCYHDIFLFEEGDLERQTQTHYKGREKPKKMADAMETGTYPSERLSAQEESWAVFTH